jgi:hypothetical protein
MPGRDLPQRRLAAGNSRTRKVLNDALRSLGSRHDKRLNPGIPELQWAELMLYGSISESQDILGRWNQVLVATAIRDRDRDNPLNRSRKYLKAGVRALQWGDFSVARGLLRSARIEQEKYVARNQMEITKQ